MNKRIFHLIIVVFAFTLVARAVPVVAADEEPTESYIVALPMIEGFEDTQIVDVFRQVGEVVGKKIGVNVVFKSLPFKHNEDLFEKVKDMFAKKEADISYVNGRDHGAMLLDGKPNYEVLAVLGMNKSPIEKGCFYARPGEFDSVEELRGKKWMGSNTVIPRFVMFKNGIDEPMESFFDVQGFETDSPIAPLLGKLKSGEIDVFSTYYHTVYLTGELKKKDPEIEVVDCEPMESHWVFVARPGLPEKRVEQLKKTFQGAHKDQDFKQFGFAFMMIDGHFMKMDDKVGAVNKEFAKLIREHNWTAEEKEFFKKYFKE